MVKMKCLAVFGVFTELRWPALVFLCMLRQSSRRARIKMVDPLAKKSDLKGQKTQGKETKKGKK